MDDGDASWVGDRIADLENQLEAEHGRRVAAKRELAEARAQLAGAVPVSELRHLVGLCEAYARGEDGTAREVVEALREFVAIAERRAAAKGEG